MNDYSALKTTLDMFGTINVMNIKIYELAEGSVYSPHKALCPADFVYTGIYLDTLKISNIKSSSAKKQFNIGMNNMPLIKWGQQITINIQDALGRSEALTKILNFIPDINGDLYLNNNFNQKPLFLEGVAPIINPYNPTEIEEVYIQIPCFVSEGAVNLVFDNGSNVSVFDFNGQAFPARLIVRDFINDVYADDTFIVKISKNSYFITENKIISTPIGFLSEEEV